MLLKVKLHAVFYIEIIILLSDNHSSLLLFPKNRALIVQCCHGFTNLKVNEPKKQNNILCKYILSESIISYIIEPFSNYILQETKKCWK